MKIKEQAPIFFEQIQTRQRHPVKPATLAAYRGALNNWIVPSLGEQDMETFGNGVLKAFVHKLVVLRKSPATIQQIVMIVKALVASAVTPDGDPLYPKTWNSQFLDIPDIGVQRSPTLTPEQLRASLRSKYAALYAFLAGTGLRIGEALAVRYGEDGVHTAYDPENAVVRVRTQLWRGKEGTTKTEAGVREVDLDPRLNALLRGIISFPVTPGLYHLFHNSGGTVWESSLRTYSLKPLGIPGFHTFRRFRITHLRKAGVPEQLIKYWVGHAYKADITDLYSRIDEDKEFTKSWAVRAGLGFELPEIEDLDATTKA
jgi:integrase